MPQVGSHVDLKKTPESMPIKTHNQWRSELALVLSHAVSPLIKQQFGDVRRSPPDRPWMMGR